LQRSLLSNHHRMQVELQEIWTRSDSPFLGSGSATWLHWPRRTHRNRNRTLNRNNLLPQRGITNDSPVERRCPDRHNLSANGR
jgi:hypothetical protein